MNKAMIILACYLLTGCPSGNKFPYDKQGWIRVSKDRICYSINKNEVLSNYYLESNEDNTPHILLSSGRNATSLTYPDTCFSIKLKSGYQYEALYILDRNKYRYRFFIDNNWNVISLKGDI